MKKTAEAVKHHGRHLFLFYLARTLIAPFVGIRMAYSVRREKGPEPPYIILSNHNSDLDPALVTRGNKGHTYFVASEHAFRKGLPSKILAFVFDPIYINKAQPDAYTMKEIFRRLKAGYNVCIFAEGNRSYNGLTGDMVLATAKMVKISGASLLTFRIEGGYFTTPRWGKKWRRGKASGRITGRYSAAELKSMTNDQVLELIKKGIHEDAYERQKKNQFRFRGKDLAEYIETVLYLCPSCKKIGTIHSKGNKFSCSCGLDAEYLETGFLEGKIQGGSPPPRAYLFPRSPNGINGSRNSLRRPSAARGTARSAPMKIKFCTKSMRHPGFPFWAKAP